MAALTPPPSTKRKSRKDSESTLIIPTFIPTMQPALVDEPPAGDDWLHEIKYDGYRTQLAIGGSQVRAFTRNGHDWTAKYPDIAQAAGRIDCQSALIDGEVCVQDERGVTDFAALRSAMTKEPWRLVFFAFDLLHLNGVDLRRQPLEERRAHLRWILEGNSGSAMATAQTSSSLPTRWGLRVSSRSARAVDISPAERTPGSRSRLGIPILST